MKLYHWVHLTQCFRWIKVPPYCTLSKKIIAKLFSFILVFSCGIFEKIRIFYFWLSPLTRILLIMYKTFCSQCMSPPPPAIKDQLSSVSVSSACRNSSSCEKQGPTAIKTIRFPPLIYKTKDRPLVPDRYIWNLIQINYRNRNQSTKNFKETVHSV